MCALGVCVLACAAAAAAAHRKKPMHKDFETHKQ